MFPGSGIIICLFNFFGWYNLTMPCIFKEIFALPLILSLIFSSVICCCLSAHADDLDQHPRHVVATAENGHCESHNPQDSHSDKKHKCECPKLQGTLAQNNDILKPPDVYFSFLNHHVLALKSSVSIILDTHLMRYDPSPPQLSSKSQPLYLKYSVLRI